MAERRSNSMTSYRALIAILVRTHSSPSCLFFLVIAAVPLCFMSVPYGEAGVFPLARAPRPYLATSRSHFYGVPHNAVLPSPSAFTC